MNSFTSRCYHLPLPTNSARQARQVLRVVEELAVGDVAGVAARVRRRLSVATQWNGRRPGVERSEAPPLAQVKALLFSNALVDLAEAGWGVEVDGRSIQLSAPAWKVSGVGVDHAQLLVEKEAVRRSLLARARERLQTPGARRFLERAESAGVLRLVAHGDALARDLRDVGPRVVQPVLCPARPADGNEEATGLPLHDVYRYMRYTWSFPYESTPGRSFPFLVRDAGQPGAPVCGLIGLASPVPRLEARDASFGWSVRRVSAYVRALGVLEDHSRKRSNGALAADLASAALIAAGSTLRGESRERIGGVVLALAESLELAPTRSADMLARAAASLEPGLLRRRVHQSRRRLAGDLVDELDLAWDQTSFEDLPVTGEEALRQPEEAAIQLEAVVRQARAAHRGAESGRLPPSSEPGASGAVGPRDALFIKKRAKLLVGLLPAKAALSGVARALAGEGAEAGLRGALEAACDPADPSPGVVAVTTRRRVRFLAAQVADVNVCGAVPPYGPLLGGKLAGLLALSSDVGEAYHSIYEGRIGEIQARLAGREVARSGDLVGLSTSSFYPVGSAQYNRLGLPEELGGVRWRHVGASRGIGSLHFSTQTSTLAQHLLGLVGRRISSEFGEGPSERIRKLREALKLVGLPINNLLEHGMRRPVYTALLQPGTAFGGVAAAAPHRVAGPKAFAVSAYWRDRWLKGRLERPHVLDEVARHTPEDLTISRLCDASPLPPAPATA